MIRVGQLFKAPYGAISMGLQEGLRMGGGTNCHSHPAYIYDEASERNASISDNFATV